MRSITAADQTKVVGHNGASLYDATLFSRDKRHLPLRAFDDATREGRGQREREREQFFFHKMAIDDDAALNSESEHCRHHHFQFQSTNTRVILTELRKFRPKEDSAVDPDASRQLLALLKKTWQIGEQEELLRLTARGEGSHVEGN